MTFDNVLKRVVKGDDAEADNDEDRVSITTAADPRKNEWFKGRFNMSGHRS